LESAVFSLKLFVGREMNTVVAPILESLTIDDMTRAPPLSTKSSFTVKDILELPSNAHSYSLGNMSNTGCVTIRRTNGYSECYSETRRRITSGSSVHSSEYEYGHFENTYYPNQCVSLNGNDNPGQRIPCSCEESQSRLLAERENYSPIEARFNNIENSERLMPSGKRVYSVESIAESSGSTSPSTLPPSPLLCGPNGQDYFHKRLEKNVTEDQKEDVFSPNKLSYFLQTDDNSKLNGDLSACNVQTYISNSQDGSGFETTERSQEPTGEAAASCLWQIFE